MSGSIGGNWLVSIPSDMRVTAAGTMRLDLMPLCWPSIAAVLLRSGYRRWKWIGVLVALIPLLTLHICLYLVVIRSVVA